MQYHKIYQGQSCICLHDMIIFTVQRAVTRAYPCITPLFSPVTSPSLFITSSSSRSSKIHTRIQCIQLHIYNNTHFSISSQKRYKKAINPSRYNDNKNYTSRFCYFKELLFCLWKISQCISAPWPTSLKALKLQEHLYNTMIFPFFSWSSQKRIRL